MSKVIHADMVDGQLKPYSLENISTSKNPGKKGVEKGFSGWMGFKSSTGSRKSIEQYSKDWHKDDVQDYDKLTQIFGIDNTNIIINLPYIFDLVKGTRLKGHYLLRTVRKSKKIVNVVMCRRWMNITTEKAKFVPDFTWNNVPNIEELYPRMVEEYERKKLEYNNRKKQEFMDRRNKKSSVKRGMGKVFGKI